MAGHSKRNGDTICYHRPCLQSWGGIAPLSLLIYSFHMPLFFILSGYTLSNRTIELDMKALIVKYFKALILPYILYTIINSFLHILLTGRYDLIISYAKSFLYLRGWMATWFLSALFVACVECVMMLKITEHPCIALIFTTVVSNVIASNTGFIPGKLKCIALGTMATPFVLFGYMLKNEKLEKVYFSRYFAICSAVFLPIIAFYNGKVDFVSYNFGKSSVLWMIAGIIGSSVVMFISRNLNSDYLQKLGRNSLTIMCIHQIIMLTCSAIISHYITTGYLFFAVLLVMTMGITIATYPIVSEFYNRYIKG